MSMDKYWELTESLPNQHNQEVINEFLLSLKLANRSEGTIRLYRTFLAYFFRERFEEFNELTSDTIQEWFISHQAKLKEATIRLRISILSSFFMFCVEEEYLEKSFIKRRWYPRLPQTLPKYLEKEDIAKVRQQSEKISLRDRILVELMLASGCRIGEMAQLDWKDIDLENRTARVVGKGNKIRDVHFTDKCAILLEKYMEYRPNNASALFASSDGYRLTKRRLQQIITELGEESNLSSGLHAHRLRHTFATELLAKGADLAFIGDELGHSDIGTTRIYARLPKREIVSQYRKYMG